MGVVARCRVVRGGGVMLRASRRMRVGCRACGPRPLAAVCASVAAIAWRNATTSVVAYSLAVMHATRVA